MSNKVADLITKKFIDALNEDVLPWQKGWILRGGPRNLVSKKPYRGINPLMLSFFGGGDQWFLTFNQIKALGGKLVDAKGSGIPICFYSPIENKKEKDAKGNPKKFMMMRYYLVFPFSKTEGIKAPAEEAAFEHTPVEAAEILLANNECPVSFGGDRACYTPALHSMNMPTKESFKTPEAFYKTYFHEIGHSLARETGVALDVNFGSETYSQEELVAEIFSSFCMNHCGILTDSIMENSKAYVKGWVSKLKSQPEIILKAAGQAQKRFDIFAGNVFNYDNENEN
jgi:antirestriction protein ArdC